MNDSGINSDLRPLFLSGNPYPDFFTRPARPRSALSKRFPVPKPVIEEVKIAQRRWQTRHARYQVTSLPLERTTVFSNHQSLLRRRLGTSDPAMQEGKIRNLELAVPKFANLVIEPGQTLSFWKTLGRASRRDGFVSGMLIANGQAVPGVGGGLFQLANLLHWMALHSPLEVTEHHHHSLDIFPDSGRVLPFGSGASVYYNYLDLQLHNPTAYRTGLGVWLSETRLHGTLWTDAAFPDAFKVQEEDHAFYRRADGQIYRTNSLFQLRRDRRTGELLARRLITRNDARVMYEPSGVEIRGDVG